MDQCPHHHVQQSKQLPSDKGISRPVKVSGPTASASDGVSEPATHWHSAHSADWLAADLSELQSTPSPSLLPFFLG